jgi:hypothetical protein
MDKELVEADHDEWLKMFNSRVSSELSLARNGYTTTHQWVITLTVALITAVLALGRGSIEYPTQFGFIAVLVITPLMVRFFVRSCLEYAIFRRWVAIRNAIDKYFYLKGSGVQEAQAKEYLDEVIRLYYFLWKSAIKRKVLLVDTLRMAFLWPLIVLISLIVWGVICLSFSVVLAVVGVVVAAFVFVEVKGIFTYSGFDYAKPSFQQPEIKVLAAGAKLNDRN